jgi:hypothetical protein
MVQVVNYTPEQQVPFHCLFGKYWDEVELEPPIDNIPFEGANGPDITNQMQAKLYSYEREGAKIRLAYHERELIGFLIYHMIFNSIMIEPEYRGKSIWPVIVRHGFGKNLKRVFGQSYTDKEPPFFKNEDKESVNKVIHVEGNMKIWELEVLEE